MNMESPVFWNIEKKLLSGYPVQLLINFTLAFAYCVWNLVFEINNASPSFFDRCYFNYVFSVNDDVDEFLSQQLKCT